MWTESIYSSELAARVPQSEPDFNPTPFVFHTQYNIVDSSNKLAWSGMICLQ